jgi:hypothetical protein
VRLTHDPGPAEDGGEENSPEMTSQTVRILAFLLFAVPLGCAAKQERDPAAPSESAPAGSPAFATPPPPAAPEPAADAEKDSALEESRAESDPLASAQAELEAARRELEQALEPLARNQSSATGGAAPPAAAAPSRSRPADGADEAPKSKADKKTAESSCQTACRAFQSLGRAAGSICRLAGDKDERCSHARGIVSHAERRVTACGCKSE